MNNQIEELIKEADKGNVEAKYKVGELYYKSGNFTKAYIWYKKAADSQKELAEQIKKMSTSIPVLKHSLRIAEEQWNLANDRYNSFRRYEIPSYFLFVIATCACLIYGLNLHDDGLILDTIILKCMRFFFIPYAIALSLIALSKTSLKRRNNLELTVGLISNEINNKIGPILRDNDNQESLQENESPIPPSNTIVYISYARSDDDNPRVDGLKKRLEHLFKKANIKYEVDTNTDDKIISDFEKRIGKGQIVVVILSNKYFRSSHCMVEWQNIRNSDTPNRKIIYVKFDEEDINVNGEIIRNGFDLGNTKYLTSLTDYWDDKRRKYEKIDRNVVEPTEVEIKDSENNFYKETFRRMNNFLRNISYYKTSDVCEFEIVDEIKKYLASETQSSTSPNGAA